MDTRKRGCGQVVQISLLVFFVFALLGHFGVKLYLMFVDNLMFTVLVLIKCR